MTEQRIDSRKQIAGDDLGPSRSASERAVGTTAAAAATGALACGAVCVVPVLLPAIALTGVGTVLAWMVGAHAWASALALAAVAGAWAWIAWRIVRTGARPARQTLLVMGFATAMLALALAWPAIEPQLIQMISSAI